MALDPYAPCPCGSGKKFKWCCQPIHTKVSKAFELDQEGQHDAAIQMMEQLEHEHSGNPEVFGRKAQLLYQMDKVDDAEAALQKAFELNPQYPFGQLLRGRFRHYEGEIPGALALFRKATDYYDPAARSILSQLFGMIAECEMQLKRPIAGRAALQIAKELNPSSQELRDLFQSVFGAEGPFPEIASKPYELKPIADTSAIEQKTEWTKALEGASSGKISDAIKAFEMLSNKDPQNAAAWYNLALCRAWYGDNPAALEALERYIELEQDEDQGAAAWALAEVLRSGQGMEDSSDYVNYHVIGEVRDGNAIANLLGELEQEYRLIGTQVDEQTQVLTAMILEKVQSLTPESQGREAPRLGAYIMLVGDRMRLWSANKELLDKTWAEIQQRAGGAIGQTMGGRGPGNFADIFLEAMVFPVRMTDEEEIKKRIDEARRQYFEETWIQRPLKSLNQVAPIDAAAHATLRKKLRGVVEFLESCADQAKMAYDFDRLRQKLRLDEGAPPVQSEGDGVPSDITSLNAAQLTALDVDSLSNEQAEQAYQTALRLDAREVAGRFARSLISRPAEEPRPDRYNSYNLLILLALADEDHVAAINFINEGQSHDCEHNEGRRRNDFELRRGQIYA